jgi:hypothetical protein
MKRIRILLAACVCAALCPTVRASTYVIGADARPNVVGGKLFTDAYNDATATLETDVRHFGYQLGASASNPYFTADPGFNAVVGSGLPASQQLRFDIVHRLKRWDGNGTVRFIEVPNQETLRFSFGAASAIATGNNDAVGGFVITNIASGGTLHRHLNSTLQGNPSAAATPSAGLYFTAIRLSVSGGAVERSDAIYLAYNNGLAAADFQRGMNYLANPTPGDTDFDADVDFNDLLKLAQNYSSNTDASWFDGDFDRDRTVQFNDLLALAQNYGATGNFAAGEIKALSFDADWALAQSIAQSIVPEPTALIALACAMTLTARRRPAH